MTWSGSPTSFQECDITINNGIITCIKELENKNTSPHGPVQAVLQSSSGEVHHTSFDQSTHPANSQYDPEFPGNSNQCLSGTTCKITVYMNETNKAMLETILETESQLMIAEILGLFQSKFHDFSDFLRLRCVSKIFQACQFQVRPSKTYQVPWV